MRLMITLLCLLMLPLVASAQRPRQNALQHPQQSVVPSCPCPTCECPQGVCPNCQTTAAPTANPGTEGDGLDEVNAQRAARGLRPFLRDPLLTIAARGASAFRAAQGLFGHTSNDFGFIPAGGQAASAGCAAYPAHYGWLSCCTFENHTRAGAYWTLGRDGRRFMHLFVGDGLPPVQQVQEAPKAVPQVIPQVQNLTPKPIGNCPGPEYEWGERPGVGWGWKLKSSGVQVQPQSLPPTIQYYPLNPFYATGGTTYYCTPGKA